MRKHDETGKKTAAQCQPVAATRVGLQKSRSRESRLLFGSPESCALTDTAADVRRTRCGVLVLRAAHFYLMTRWILWVQPLSFGATTGRYLQAPRVYPSFFLAVKDYRLGKELASERAVLTSSGAKLRFVSQIDLEGLPPQAASSIPNLPSSCSGHARPTESGGRFARHPLRAGSLRSPHSLRSAHCVSERTLLR